MELITESVLNQDGRPLVNLRWPAISVDASTQWSPDEARRYALVILETAEAAEHDAAFYKWATEGPLDLDPRSAAQLLAEQRQYRAGL